MTARVCIIGGNWRYDNDNQMLSAHQSLQISTSRQPMEYAAWRTPDDLPDYPRLVQPIGATMPLAEARAEWVADLVTGVGALPSRHEMRRQIADHDAHLRRRYVASERQP
jgi:Flavin-binding monooxygenase-like